MAIHLEPAQLPPVMNASNPVRAEVSDRGKAAEVEFRRLRLDSKAIPAIKPEIKPTMTPSAMQPVTPTLCPSLVLSTEDSQPGVLPVDDSRAPCKRYGRTGQQAVNIPGAGRRGAYWEVAGRSVFGRQACMTKG